MSLNVIRLWVMLSPIALIMACARDNSALEQVRAAECRRHVIAGIGLEPCFREQAEEINLDAIGTMNDVELMTHFGRAIKSTGTSNMKLASEQTKLLYDEVDKRKLVYVDEMNLILLASQTAEFRGVYVGMHKGLLIAFRNAPYEKNMRGDVEKWDYKQKFALVTFASNIRHADYVCIRKDRVSGVFQHYCNHGDCKSKNEGESC